MKMKATALTYYRRLTIAALTACVIIVGSTATAAFNNPSSLLPPQPSSSSSSSSSARCCCRHHLSRRAHSTHEILGYHQYHNHRLIGRRVGSNAIKEELELGTVALFASAYNDETTTAAARLGAAAAAITTAAITSAAAVAPATETTISSPTIPTSSNYRTIQDDSIISNSVGNDNGGKEIIQSSVPISSHHLIAPSIPKILRYTIPAIGIWLCSPVLSMIDTASVGLLSGTAQQAALNPAASVTDCGALVVAFMYTATTNLIAAAVREDVDEHEQLEEEELEQLSDLSSMTTTSTSNTPTTTTTTTTTRTTNYKTHQNGTTRRRQPKATKTLITALKLALLVGTTFAITLMSTAPYLLQLLMGKNAASSLDQQVVVYSAALRYVRIRALGMPAMVVIGTAQSACLGMQDVRSPLYVLLAAAVINFLGDVALVPLKSHLWGGAAGAAWATVASQYAALLFFARWLTMKKSDDSSNGARRRKRTMPLFGRSGRKEGLMRTTTAEGMIANHESFGWELSDPLPPTSLSTAIPTGDKPNDDMNRNHFGADPEIKQPRQQQYRQTLVPEQTTSQTKIRGFLSDSNFTPRTFLSVHNLDTNKVKEFFPFVIPVTTTSIGRISGYIAMSHVAASTLGTFDMAAHQIILSIFCCITPFVDALSQVAQSFVPAVFEAKERGQERANALRKTVNNFRLVGLGFGGVLVSLVACIPLISRYFTTDLVVLERVHSAIAPVGLFMLVNGLMCAGEGTLLGQKDLKFLRNMYAIFFFTVPAYMLRLKHRALIGVQTVGVATMWTAFSMYNVIRASSFHLRLAQLQRRTDARVMGNENYKVS